MKPVKVGTQIDAELIRRARVHAARAGKKLRFVFEEALRGYLDGAEPAKSKGRISDSWGALKLERRDFQALLKSPLWHEVE
jgi:hypothetical protein